MACQITKNKHIRLINWLGYSSCQKK